jgi:hypothetical protein
MVRNSFSEFIRGRQWQSESVLILLEHGFVMVLLAARIPSEMPE